MKAGSSVPPISYELLEEQVRALVHGESDFIANAANFAAFVFYQLPDVSWAGFYFVTSSSDLLLGPFCGRPACTRLPAGRGVCGAAVLRRTTLVVDDVGAFEDHIVCDAVSASEIVVPCIVGGEIAGVFDVDSPKRARFSAIDRSGIERLVSAFNDSVCWAPVREGSSSPRGS